jgi:hypothetical protein
MYFVYKNIAISMQKEKPSYAFDACWLVWKCRRNSHGEMAGTLILLGVCPKSVVLMRREAASGVSSLRSFPYLPLHK